MKNQEFAGIAVEERLSSVNYVIRAMMETCEHLSGASLVPRDPGDGGYVVSPAYLGTERGGNGYRRYYPRFRWLDAVVGVDSSVYPLAESSDGFVFAICGAIVVERGGVVDVRRVGPIIFYASPRSIASLARALGIEIPNPARYVRDVGRARKLAISIFEAGLLLDAVKLGETVLLDGSLERMPSQAWDGIRQAAGVSKRSQLFKQHPDALAEVVRSPIPVVVHVGFRRGLSVYLGKFGRHGVPLRLDVPVEADCEAVFDGILANVHDGTGYPNVLREAHIASKILKSEVLGMMARLMAMGARIAPSVRLRDLLFGPFNRPPSEWVTPGAGV
ncbi:hypothetical protein B6U99_00190 [Candidatus Geothermarchaeota archaeon ex4572_27]|nr:MAG: hypothetical protein B6U99_00190 [Candidatus Geothermarchaeota archaeon ex4572_27]